MKPNKDESRILQKKDGHPIENRKNIDWVLLHPDTTQLSIKNENKRRAYRAEAKSSASVYPGWWSHFIYKIQKKYVR